MPAQIQAFGIASTLALQHVDQAAPHQPSALKEDAPPCYMSTAQLASKAGCYQVAEAADRFAYLLLNN